MGIGSLIITIKARTAIFHQDNSRNRSNRVLPLSMTSRNNASGPCYIEVIPRLIACHFLPLRKKNIVSDTGGNFLVLCFLSDCASPPGPLQPVTFMFIVLPCFYRRYCRLTRIICTSRWRIILGKMRLWKSFLFSSLGFLPFVSFL